MVWLKAIFLVVLYFFLIFVFNKLMGRFLELETPVLFSEGYINENHKKIYTATRVIFIVSAFIMLFYTARESIKLDVLTDYFLAFIVLMLLVIPQLTRAYMEWRYVENKKAFIFTLSQLVFFLLILAIFFYSNLFNWI